MVGESAEFTTAVVRTQYGPGVIVEERADGVFVVDLVYGRAFLQPAAILGRQAGFFAATSMFQLQRLDRLHGMLKARGLNEEEAAWIDDACLMRYLLSCDWDAGKAFAAVVDTLEWRFGSGPNALRPHTLAYKDMQTNLSAFPCFLAGHGGCIRGSSTST